MGVNAGFSLPPARCAGPSGPAVDLGPLGPLCSPREAEQACAGRDFLLQECSAPAHRLTLPPGSWLSCCWGRACDRTDSWALPQGLWIQYVGVEHGMSLSLLMLQFWGPHSENHWFLPKALRICGGTCQVSWWLKVISETCRSVDCGSRGAWAPASQPSFPER